MKAIAKGKKPAGMGYGDYSSCMQKAGEEPMDESDYNDLDEDGDEDEEKSEAGEVDPDALSKALRAFDNITAAAAGAGDSRESYLKAKFDAGTITKSERQEYGRILAGEDDGEEPFRKSMTERISDTDDESGRLVEANGFLKSLVDSIDDALDHVTSEVARESKATRELLKSLGEISKAQSHIIRDLHQRLATVENSPRQPRAVTTQPRQVVERGIAKSNGGGGSRSAAAGGEDKLTKSQTLAGLRRLMDQAIEKSDQKAIAMISHETAKIENGGPISKRMYEAVVAELNG
jgi:hypothetical protein